jgi:hypothetical protein
MQGVHRRRSMRTSALILPIVAILAGCAAVTPPATEDRSQADKPPLNRDSMPAPRLLSRASTGFCMIVDAYTGECATD